MDALMVIFKEEPLSFVVCIAMCFIFYKAIKGDFNGGKGSKKSDSSSSSSGGSIVDKIKDKVTGGDGDK